MSIPTNEPVTLTPGERFLFERMEALADLVSNGGVPPRRWMCLKEAAIFCGFAERGQVDRKFAAFKKFICAEQIPYKKGNLGGKFEMLFDVVDLTRAMSRNKRNYAA